MSTVSLAILFGLFLFILALRFLGERQLAALPREHKLRLIDGFRDLRRFNAVALLVVLAVIGAPLVVTSLPLTVTQVGLVLMVVAVSINGLLSIRRLRALDFPPRFVRFQYVRMSALTVGMAAYAISLLSW